MCNGQSRNELSGSKDDAEKSRNLIRASICSMLFESNGSFYQQISLKLHNPIIAASNPVESKLSESKYVHEVEKKTSSTDSPMTEYGDKCRFPEVMQAVI